MALTGAVVREALAAVGAVGKQLRSFDELAAGASAALRQAPSGLTAAGAAAFLATCAVESAWFRTTVEYGSGQRYAPYVGRTFVQLTWEANYHGFGRWCHGRGLVADPLVFVRDPVQLGAYQFAWLGPVFYFETTRLWEWANAGDFRRVSQAVNGGRGRAGTEFTPNGWSDRQAMYEVFLRAGAGLLPGRPSPRPAPTTAEEVDDMFTDDDRRVQREIHAKLHGAHRTRVDYALLGLTPPAEPHFDDAGGFAINADARAFEARELAGQALARVDDLVDRIDALLARPAGVVVPGEVVARTGAPLVLTFTGTATAAPNTEKGSTP